MQSKVARLLAGGLLLLGTSSTSCLLSSSGCDRLGFCADCEACALTVGGDEDDSGVCAEAAAACDPSEFGTPCYELETCIELCDLNQDGALSAGAELDCVCANDGEDCTQQSLAGSCHDDFPEGLALRQQLEACLSSTCSQSCI